MHLRLEQHIDAPADAVWRTLGPRFAEIDEWAGVVTASRAIDPGEVPASLTVAPSAPVPGRETVTKAKLVEVLTDYDDHRRTLTFEGIGLPPIIRRARDRQSVVPTGPRSSVAVFEIDLDLVGPFTLAGPLVKRRMASTFGGVLADLKRHVESRAATRPAG